MIKDVLVIESNPKSWEEAIEITYSTLYKAGYVKESFLQGCIEREKKYPTGLMTAIPVAVPHTDSVHIITPSICVMRLKEPVAFHNMEDPDSTVDAQFVFNMALESGNDQISMLQSIIKTAQDSEFLKEAKHQPLDLIREKLIKDWNVYCNIKVEA